MGRKRNRKREAPININDIDLLRRLRARKGLVASLRGLKEWSLTQLSMIGWSNTHMVGKGPSSSLSKYELKITQSTNHKKVN